MCHQWDLSHLRAVNLSWGGGELVCHLAHLLDGAASATLSTAGERSSPEGVFSSVQCILTAFS